jgi:hypothetical protein
MASKSQHVLDAEELAAKMKDPVFCAEQALCQTDDLSTQFEAKAKTEAAEHAQVDADMHARLANAEAALDIGWMKVGEGCWKSMKPMN